MKNIFNNNEKSCMNIYFFYFQVKVHQHFWILFEVTSSYWTTIHQVLISQKQINFRSYTWFWFFRQNHHIIFYFSGEAVLTSGWCTGTCERTEDRGDFPAEAVYVLPCLSRPPDDILVRQLEFNPFFTSIVFFIF